MSKIKIENYNLEILKLKDKLDYLQQNLNTNFSKFVMAESEKKIAFYNTKLIEDRIKIEDIRKSIKNRLLLNMDKNLYTLLKKKIITETQAKFLNKENFSELLFVANIIKLGKDATFVAADKHILKNIEKINEIFNEKLMVVDSKEYIEYFMNDVFSKKPKKEKQFQQYIG